MPDSYPEARHAWRVEVEDYGLERMLAELLV